MAHFSIPLAVFLVGSVGCFIQYLAYVKNTNELKAQWQQENEANLREAKSQIDKLNQAIAERDRVIARQKTELDKYANAPPIAAPPTTGFKFDPDRYIINSDLLKPASKTWDETAWAFVSDYWKLILAWGPVCLIAAVVKKR